MRRFGYARCEARQSHDLGLQVSHRVDHEVRFPVLGEDSGQRARELLREIALAHEMVVYAGAMN